MAEKHGIKETREVMVGLAAIGAKALFILGDGIKLDDLSKLVDLAGDEEFKALVKAAYENINLVDDEIKDISFIEGAELLMVLPALIEQVKAAKASVAPAPAPAPAPEAV